MSEYMTSQNSLTILVRHIDKKDSGFLSAFEHM